MRIRTISEAYSMQPITLTVVETPASFNPEDSIKEIKLEVRNYITDVSTDFYVGYNFEGKKIFEYVAAAVNVHYF